MSYHEEGQVRLRRLRSKEAIALALQGRWREAIAANKSILESFPDDIGTYNRLGRAYMELGEYSLAREAYSRTMELDPYNIIAEKNLRRLSHLRETTVSSDGDSQKAEPQYFIEEIGKAGVVKLYRLAPPEVLVRMVAGDRVYLDVEGANLAVVNGRGEYLGQVEPRHGLRLVKLINGGNKYSAAIISSTEESISVIVREVYQDPSQAGQLSFPPRGLERLGPTVTNRIAKRGDYEALLEESVENDGEGSIEE